MPSFNAHVSSIFNLFRAAFGADDEAAGDAFVVQDRRPEKSFERPPEEEAIVLGNKYLPRVLLSLDQMGSAWRVRNAVEGVQIFGGIGSGKTSGSGQTLAMTYLTAGFGGLVLTVKPDEKALWQAYCRKAGRDKDLIVIEPDGKYHFDFLAYESGIAGAMATANILHVLETVIRAGDEKDNGGGENRFWDTALRLLMSNVIDLCRIAYGAVSVQRMYDIVQSLPRGKDQAGGLSPEKETAFQAAGRLASEKVAGQIAAWEETQDRYALARLKEDDLYEETVYGNIPDARQLRLVERYFTTTYAELAEKTRSIIDFSFTGFLSPLMRDPFFSLFCRAPSGNGPAQAARPELSMEGKIILLNLPVKLHHRAGRDCQIMYKYIWQRAMERREIGKDSLPVFLWADEAQHFLHAHDAEFQATARSSMIATVYLSQNLPNYFASMGGDKSQFRVMSFLGTLATKIFHANGDTETNTYASHLIGQILYEDTSTSEQSAYPLEGSSSVQQVYDLAVRPLDFQQLLGGGAHNKGIVTAIAHFQGPVLKGGKTYIEIGFRQESLTEEL